MVDELHLRHKFVYNEKEYILATTYLKPLPPFLANKIITINKSLNSEIDWSVSGMYETMILHRLNSIMCEGHYVERYKSIDDAKKRHWQLVEKIENNQFRVIPTQKIGFTKIEFIFDI